MKFADESIYHIYNRGNQQQRIFFSRENYLFFLRKMRKELSPFCDFISYSLMPNHFHWIVLVKQAQLDSLISNHLAKNNRTFNNAIGTMLRSYARAIQLQEGFTGSLFQQKTKSKKILSLSNPVILRTRIIAQHDDFFTCFNYVHQNPFMAGLVKRLADWEFSSFREYAGLRRGTLCNQKLGFELLGIHSREEFQRISYEVLNEKLIKRIF